MKIGIIGAGRVGGALATGLTKTEHEIVVGARNPDSEKVIKLLNENPEITVFPLEAVGDFAEVIIVSVTPPATKEVCERLGEVSDKVIIDTMNSVYSKPLPYDNTTEALQKWTKSPHVVKCFNSTGYENLKNPDFNGRRIDMFMAGNSSKGKEIANRLAKDLGFGNCYDFGEDDKIPLLEQLAKIWINLALQAGYGRDIAFQIIKR